MSRPIPDIWKLTCSRRLEGLGTHLAVQWKLHNEAETTVNWIQRWGSDIISFTNDRFIRKQFILITHKISLPFFKLAAVLPKLCFCGTKFTLISFSYRAGFFKIQFYLESEDLILCSLCLSDSNIKTVSNEYEKK